MEDDEAPGDRQLSSVPFEVLPWRPEHTAGVVAVIHSVYDEYRLVWDEDGYHADLHNIQAHYLDHGDSFWVAVMDGQVVGTVALERFAALPGSLGSVIPLNGFLRVGGTDCSMERLYVSPDQRGLGIGSALVKTVIEFAILDGRLAMELWSDKLFVDAHRLYARFGAQVVGERICHDPDQSPEWGLLLETKRACTPR